MWARSTTVSIPIWFDLKRTLRTIFALRSLVSIPIWFDLKFLKEKPLFPGCSVSIPIWFDLKYSGSAICVSNFSFNSYMVRFKVFNDLHYDDTALFQFLYGSI